jgi:hypothetical protein
MNSKCTIRFIWNRSKELQKINAIERGYQFFKIQNFFQSLYENYQFLLLPLNLNLDYLLILVLKVLKTGNIFISDLDCPKKSSVVCCRTVTSATNLRHWLLIEAKFWRSTGRFRSRGRSSTDSAARPNRRPSWRRPNRRPSTAKSRFVRSCKKGCPTDGRNRL